MTEGCSKERHQHSKISLDKRTLSEGGTVLEYGNRDIEHCYLDFLLNEGLLGEEPDSRTRYDTGYKLRELYFEFKTSGNAMGQSGRRSQFISEAEIGNENDLAETLYNRVLRALPGQYREYITSVCLDTREPRKASLAYHNLIIEGLDALYGAFKRGESELKEALERDLKNV